MGSMEAPGEIFEDTVLCEMDIQLFNTLLQLGYESISRDISMTPVFPASFWLETFYILIWAHIEFLKLLAL